MIHSRFVGTMILIKGRRPSTRTIINLSIAFLIVRSVYGILFRLMLSVNRALILSKSPF